MSAGMAAMGLGSIISFTGSMRGSYKVESLARQNADLIKWETDVAIAQQRAEARALMGAQLAGYAGAGVLTTEGTPADLVRDTSLKMERDSLHMRYSGYTQARIVKAGGKLQGSSMRYGAVGGLFGSAGNIIGGS